MRRAPWVINVNWKIAIATCVMLASVPLSGCFHEDLEAEICDEVGICLPHADDTASPPPTAGGSEAGARDQGASQSGADTPFSVLTADCQDEIRAVLTDLHSRPRPVPFGLFQNSLEYLETWWGEFETLKNGYPLIPLPGDSFTTPHRYEPPSGEEPGVCGDTGDYNCVAILLCDVLGACPPEASYLATAASCPYDGSQRLSYP